MGASWGILGLFVVVMVLPPVVWCLLTKERQARAFFLLPISMALYFGFFATGAMLSYRWLPYGMGKLVLLTLVSLALVQLLLGRKMSNPRVRGGRIVSKRVLIWVALAALCLSADVILIASRQGTDSITGSSYFRPPMHNDMQRHVVVNNALLRYDGNPMLADSPLIYQTFWHHWTATLTSFWDGTILSNYPLVLTLSVLTGLLFFFVAIWAMVLMRPALFLRPFWFVAFAILVFFHADLFNLIAAYLYTGKPGMEADWSFQSNFYRYFGPKAIALTAPQHSLFFVFALVAWVARDYPMVAATVAVFAIVSSPIMGGLFLFGYVVGESAKRLWIRDFSLRWPLALAALGVGSYLLMWILYRFPPYYLFSRPGTVNTRWFRLNSMEVLGLGWLWFAVYASLGVLVLATLLVRGRGRHYLHWSLWSVLLGTPFFYFVLTNAELRRHYSMIGAISAVIFLVLFLPSRLKMKNTFLPRLVGILVIFTVLAEAYFIYAYIGKPSVMSSSVKLGPYFQMNQLVRKQFPKLPVIAGVEPYQLGLEYPPVMEVTSSYSLAAHAVIHTRMTPQQFRLTHAGTASATDVLPRARELGYRAILWGPIEQQLWGEKVKNRFVDQKKLLVESGGIGLYGIKDSILDAVKSKGKKDFEYYALLGEAYLAGDWRSEAYDAFLEALRDKPDHLSSLRGLTKLLRLAGRNREAEEVEARIEKVKQGVS